MSPQMPDSADQDIFTEVPEADAAEQATSVLPEEDTAEAEAAHLASSANEADPADLWEQAQPVPDPDDEDYDR